MASPYCGQVNNNEFCPPLEYSDVTVQRSTL